MTGDDKSALAELLLAREVEKFLINEAGLLDDRRFEDWTDLFEEDGYYWAPATIDQEDPASGVSLFFDDVPMMRLETLLSSLNDHLFLGHFRLSSDKRQVQLYYVLPLRGAGGATSEQIEDVVDILLGQCEQAAPAFAQLVVSPDRPALSAGLIMGPVVGQA